MDTIIYSPYQYALSDNDVERMISIINSKFSKTRSEGDRSVNKDNSIKSYLSKEIRPKHIRDIFLRTWLDSRLSFCNIYNLNYEDFSAWINETPSDTTNVNYVAILNHIKSLEKYSTVSTFNSCIKTMYPDIVVFIDFDAVKAPIKSITSSTGVKVVVVGVSSVQKVELGISPSRLVEIPSCDFHILTETPLISSYVLMMLVTLANMTLPNSTKFHFLDAKLSSRLNYITELNFDRVVSITDMSRKESNISYSIVIDEEDSLDAAEALRLSGEDGAGIGQNTRDEKDEVRLSSKPQSETFVQRVSDTQESVDQKVRGPKVRTEGYVLIIESLSEMEGFGNLEDYNPKPVYVQPGKEFEAAKKLFRYLCKFDNKKNNRITMDEFKSAFPSGKRQVTIKIKHIDTGKVLTYKATEVRVRDNVIRYNIVSDDEDPSTRSNDMADSQEQGGSKKRKTKKYKERIDITPELFRDVCTKINEQYLLDDDKSETCKILMAEFGAFMKREKLQGRAMDYAEYFKSEGLADIGGSLGTLHLIIYKGKVYTYLYQNEDE